MMEGARQKDRRSTGRRSVKARPTQRASEWLTLRGGLVAALGCLEDGHYLILQSRDEIGYYVQFAAGVDGPRAEAVSNKFLEGWKRLDAIAEARLRRIGWRPPTDIGDGPVNWWRQFDDPVPVGDVADLAVATLVKAYDVPRPSRLVYRAFSRQGEEILLPGLGVDRIPRPGLQRGLAPRVDAALRVALGVETVIYDRDGHVPIRHGDAMVFVRTLVERGLVVVFSHTLAGVEKTSGLLDAVNDMNTDIHFARAAIIGHSVVVTAEVDAGEDLDTSLTHACDAVGWISDHWGAKLQARFGGATWFGEPAQPSPATGTGLYL
jgi:hypothetical protein